MRARLYAVYALAALACVSTLARGEEEPAKAGETTATVRAEVPHFGRIAEAVRAIGAIIATPSATAALAPVDSQPIEWVGVQSGSPVAAGQVVVRLRLDPTTAIAREKARIARAQAELSAARMKRLVTAGVLPRVRSEEAEAALAIARADERLAVDVLDYATRTHSLASPITGVAVSVDAVAGAMSDPLRPLVKIVDPAGRMAQLFLVAPGDIARVMTGSPVVLRVAGSPPVTGAVVRLGGVLDIAQRVEVLVALPPDAPIALRPGAYVEGSIEVAAHEYAMLVPIDAIRRGEEGAAVLIIEEDKAVLMPVTLGIETRDVVEILSGIGDDDEVIVDGAYEVEPGMAVKTKGDAEKKDVKEKGAGAGSDEVRDAAP